LQATDRLTVKDTKLQLEGRDHGAAVEVRDIILFWIFHFLIIKGKETIVIPTKQGKMQRLKVVSLVSRSDWSLFYNL
jgi:hypothetical protein